MTDRQPTPDILGDIMAGAPTVQATTTTTVPLSAIVNDGGTQMRAGMNAEKVKEYEEVIAEVDAWPFPPLVVFHDGAKYWLADGFHRLNAAHRSGKFAELPAEIKAGTRRDAVLYAAGANATHGLPRTNDDKRRAVKTLMEDEEWAKWSDREIARRCAVSPMFVGNLRKELTINGLQSTTRTGADGRVYNTQNIGSNRPTRLFVGDLKGLVAKWMGMHWQHAWPDNPSHTNGEFWQQLTAWMHENVRETWQEGDLKEAIKALHYQSMEGAFAPAPAASQPAVMPKYTVEQLRGMVRACAVETEMTPAGEKTPFWHQLQTWMIRHAGNTLWSVSDLRVALDQVIRQNVKDAPIFAADDLHAGAGRTAPPAMSVAELVEELTPHLASFAPGNISGASIGAQNDVAERCALVLSDFTYQQADLYRALQRIANERHLAMSKEASAPVVNGDRPLTSWAEPDTRQAQEPATVAQTVADVVAVHGAPVEDDRYAALQAWRVRLLSVRSDLGDWARLTGRYTETLGLSRELSKLFDITQSEMDAITTAAKVAQP